MQIWLFTRRKQRGFSRDNNPQRLSPRPQYSRHKLKTTGNYLPLLGGGWPAIASYFVLPLKASLPSTIRFYDFKQADVTLWAFYPLITMNSLFNISLFVLTCYLCNKTTGHLWDPVSTADHLVLLRHAKFLTSFEETDILNSRSMFHKTGKSTIASWILGSGPKWYLVWLRTRWGFTSGWRIRKEERLVSPDMKWCQQCVDEL